MLGTVEAGGTKFVCGVGNETGEIIERISIPTTIPAETMGKVFSFFRDRSVEAIGIGCFGPLDLDLNSPTYGSITSTPKTAWRMFNILKEMQREFPIPVIIDTDVNAAVLAEHRWGAGKDVSHCLYLTVGTGIGGGAVVDGKVVHGLLHPEMGHILVKRHPKDTFSGNCPSHGDCLEGMASGPAIEKRWGSKGTDLFLAHPAWELEAYYLAQALVNYIYILSPQRLILGGGVMKQSQLFPLIRKNVLEMLHGYIDKEEILHSIDRYIVPPALGDNAGLCGGLVLAMSGLDMHLG